MSDTVLRDDPLTTRYVVALESGELRDEDSLREALDHAQSCVHDRPELARYLATLCVTAADDCGLPAVSAHGHYILARILAERGELVLALSSIDIARLQWERAGQHLPSLRTNLGRMQVLDDLGRHAEAVEVGRALLADLEQHEVPDDRRLRDELVATAWNNLGVAHSFLGDHQATIAAYASAEAGYAALGLTADVAKTQANRGIELLEVGRGREALDALVDARAQFTDTGDRMWDAKCRGNIVQAHAQLGEIVAALRELAAARDTLDELQAGAESARLQATAARLYLGIGLHRESHEEAEAAAQFLSANGMIHDAAVASLTCALSSLGVGDLDAAEPWLARAKKLFDQVGDRQSQARVTLAEADAAGLRGDNVGAARLAGRAVDLLQAGGWLVPLALAILRHADLVSDPDHEAALLARAEVLVDELGLLILRYAYLWRAGRSAHRRGDDSTAIRMLREAVEVIEEVGSTLSVAELRTAFRDDHMAAHDLLVDLLVAEGDAAAIADAAAVADLAKARTLSDFASGALGGGWRSAADRTDTRTAQLRSDLSSTYHAMHDQADRRLYATLQQRAADLEHQLTLLRVESAVDRTSGEVPDQAPLDTDPGGASELAAPVVAYHLAGPDLIIMVSARGALSAHRVPGACAVIDEHLDRLNAQWSRFALGPEFAERHQEALLATATDSLRALYDVLLRPVEDVLADCPGDDLVIVPYRRLHQVPFRALHDGSGAVQRRWSVRLAPTVADAALPEQPVQPGNWTVFAVPDAGAPAIADEARVLAEIRPEATTYVGRAATGAALRSAVPGPAVVHVACHGTYRQANPMFSALRLADGYVTASELLELDFGGALVTLSACESGRHAGNSAEPVGLAWAFLAAGASGVVVSRWLVDDAVTARLMTTLYRGIAAGLLPSAALRRAQQDIARDHPHPYFWAPFSYVASPRTVDGRSICTGSATRSLRWSQVPRLQ